MGFERCGNVGLWAMRKVGKNLVQFMDLFGSSKHFPFAHFLFKGVTWSTFRSDEWKRFLSTFGKCGRIKGLKFTSSIGLLKLVAELRDLLLNKLPKLQEFGLQFHPKSKSKSNLNSTNNKIGFFPNPKPTQESEFDSQAQSSQKLPHLKVLYFAEFMFSDYTEIVKDLLLAAVKLQRIQPFNAGLEKFKEENNFFLLQSLGKLECLEEAEIHLTSEFLSKVLNKAVAPLVLKLKALDVNLPLSFENPTATIPDATNYLSAIFEENKNTLRELTTDPLGFLEDLPLPKFSRLTDLSVITRNSWVIQRSIFPPGIELNYIFPVLNSLNLKIPWTSAFPHKDFISPLPTLRTLKIIGDDVNESTIFQISFMCPELKNFYIIEGRKGPLENFPEVGNAIWTHLRKLQSLDLSINVKSAANAFPAIDSCITGFSVEDCLRISELIKGVELLRKWGIEGRISTEEMMAAERENPSILNLKDLKDLQIRLYLNRVPLPFEKNRQDLIHTALTSISEDRALKLMENLNYEITRSNSVFKEGSF